ncbi:hypothetical protein [Methylobacterium sp. 17Sr1-1]|uniref:hypothetical protein n=1 Tax=Methylobacterium sp. 17Sr1-1 TaxID=2202826 RepID=UPI000D6FBA1A|nr:hypothetical protein [Methylobacterium sp. 17Sr1-1]AWN52174.1 hypothetical protein DK412_11240 [Methylobacterium sp. 17Sr1-1]
MKASVRKPQDAASIKAGVLSLLVALDGTPPGSPAGAAYTAALRRRGEDLAAAGGVEALREARTAAVAASPDHASVIDAAWSTIPGWPA